ncbi:MAG: histidinol-phosphate transaminase [Candidatus Nanopelagicales bacterium]|nr:histidinol-phosphate transaminase [Candidatus Nanopelagicales bacterium]
MDRNEDVVGWDEKNLAEMLGRIRPSDVAAYHDSDRLEQRISDWIGVLPSNLTVTAGSSEALGMVFDAYVDEGTNVLVLSPSYSLYEVFAAKCGARLIGFPFDSTLNVDVKSLIDAIVREQPRLIVLANPNQPTGTLINSVELGKIANTALDAGAILLVDEAYWLFTPESALNLTKDYPNVIVTRTFSKALGLAGLRLGFCAGPAERIAEVEKFRGVTKSNSIALLAAHYILDHLDWTLARVSDVVAGRDYLVNKFFESGLITFTSHANFVLLECASHKSAVQLVASARASGYAIRGPLSGYALENFVRITAGPPYLMRQFWSQCSSKIFEYAKHREQWEI